MFISLRMANNETKGINMSKKKKIKFNLKDINSIVVISDLHVGCGMAICPDIINMDDKGTYHPSVFQKKMKCWWDELWKEVVPKWTHGEKYAVVLNGDSLDGVHHKSTTQWSHNLEDQSEAAYQLLKPVVDLCGGRFYMIRGTEAHVGVSGVEEERLAKRLGAIPNSERQYARHVLWKFIGSPDRTKKRFLLNFLHHIGTTGSMAYETTAVMKELVEAYSEAGRWNRRPPDVIIRGHRHRSIEIKVPTVNQRGIALTLPAWQAKTPFAYKIAGGRQSEPQIGAVLIRVSLEGELYTREWVQSFDRPVEE